MINETLNEADTKMKKAVEVTREDFAAIRTGGPTCRCSTSSPPTTTAPRRRCSSSRRSPRPRRAVIIIAPYDMSAMAAIEKAIRDSDLGVNPTDDGKTIRVVLPEPHRGAPQGLHQDGQGQGRGRQGRGPQHPSQRQAGAREAREGRRGRQGRRHRVPRSASTASPRSTPTRSTRCSSTRKPSCSRSEDLAAVPDMTDSDEPSPAQPSRTPATPSPPVAQPRRAGRNLPGRHRLGASSWVAIIASLAFWKPAS